MAVQSADSDQRYALMRARAGELLDEVQARFSVALDGLLVIFDRSRLLLVASLAAWLWVGNMVVRRLSRLPGRMRSVAPSGLDTPAPEVGTDEIGALASAAGHLRQVPASG